MLIFAILYSQINKFPGQPIFRTLKNAVPGWLLFPFLVIQCALSWGCGLFFLIEITQSAKIFLISGHSSIMILCLFLACILPVAGLDSKSLLFIFEFIVILSLPVLILLAWRTATDDLIQVDSMIEVIMTIGSRPDLTSITAAASMFTCITPLLVFHEHLRYVPKWLRFAGLAAGFAVQLFTFLVPVGYFGRYGVENLKIAWLAVGDSMRFENILIGRMVHIFYLFYVETTLAFVILCWHCSLQFINQADLRSGGKFRWLVLSLFGVAAICTNSFASELAVPFTMFINTRFWGEIVFVLLVLWAVRARQRHSSLASRS